MGLSLGTDFDDPRTQGLLQLGLGLLGSRGSFAQSLSSAGQQGLLGYQQAAAQKAQREQQNLQRQMQEMQVRQAREALDDAQVARTNENEFRALIPAPQGQMMAGAAPMNATQADSAMGTEGYGRSSMNPWQAPVDPSSALMYQALQKKQITPMQYIQTTQKDRTPIKLGKDETLLEAGTYRPLASNVSPDKLPSSVQEYQFAVQQGFRGTFEQWDTARKRAGATNVSVSGGQKGLDNTLKLRGDFRSEPVYKAHQEMQSAYAQIQQSLKQASPAGDLAGATKVMKLLDPGSVVRESELGMAMAASGLLDRVQHYATNVLNGTKLTPTQRQDFQRLADALYGESVKQYNGKRSEYQSLAERNGLSVPDVLGAESAGPAAVRRYNPRTGRIE